MIKYLKIMFFEIKYIYHFSYNLIKYNKIITDAKKRTLSIVLCNLSKVRNQHSIKAAKISWPLHKEIWMVKKKLAYFTDSRIQYKTVSWAVKEKCCKIEKIKLRRIGKSNVHQNEESTKANWHRNCFI